jgi:arylsulfatase A-like enzyme
MRLAPGRKPGSFFVASAVFISLVIIHVSNTIGLADTTPPQSARHQYINVILISLQCLRPDHLGLYGYKRNTSQHIDKLAETSVVFENAISQANLTPVAQMSVFTSQYPRINGMVSFEVLQETVNQRTLPSILKVYDYTTAAIVSSPEFFLRYDTDAGTMVNPGDVFSRSFDYFGRTIRGPGGRSLRRVPEDAFHWLKNNKDKKFFLWIASGLNHMPYAAAVPHPYKSMYDPEGYTPFWHRLPGDAWKDVKDDPSYDIFSRVFGTDFHWGFSPAYKLTKDDVQYVNGRYDAGVFYTDLFIGQLMELLDSLDLRKKTLIILHSIHGEDLGDNGRYFHYDVTDTIVKNALLMRFPSSELGGKRVEEQVQGIDILPTILDYLEIPAPPDAQGSSLLPFLQGDRSSAPDEFTYIERMPWWEYTLHKWYLEFKSDTGAHFAESEKKKLSEYQELLHKSFEELGYPPGDIAIRSNDWKLIYRKNRDLYEKVSWQHFITGKSGKVDEVELYDLKNDPLETRNVADDNPKVVARLKEKLLKWDEATESQKVKYFREGKRWIIPYP